MTSEEATDILTKLIKWCEEYGLEGPVYLSDDELEAIKALLKERHA